jgi:hypothetical protein
MPTWSATDPTWATRPDGLLVLAHAASQEYPPRLVTFANRTQAAAAVEGLRKFGFETGVNHPRLGGPWYVFRATHRCLTCSTTIPKVQMPYHGKWHPSHELEPTDSTPRPIQGCGHPLADVERDGEGRQTGCTGCRRKGEVSR